MFAALFLDVGIIAFAFTRNYRRGVACFAMMAGALLFYILGYLLDVMSTTPGEAMLALRIENLGIPLIAPFFLLMTISFFRPRLLQKWMIIASLAYGTLMFLTVFLNDAHLLYYSSVATNYNGSFYVVQLGKGPLYYVQQAVSISCMAMAYVIIAVRYINGSAKLRQQMHLFILGSLFGFVANIANFTGMFSGGTDPTPLAMTMGLVCFVINLYRYKFMDIVPAAFDMAIETMDDAVIVLDINWGLIYCNQTACDIFPVLASFSGTEEIMCAPGWPEELSPQSDSQVNFSVINTAGETRLQRAGINPIYDKKHKPIGVSLIIRDVTEISDMLNRLEELAITDPLTGVFNRRHFMTLIDRQMDLGLRHNLPMSILLLDVDYFKRVNDTYGHLAGDYVLRMIVQTITRQMRAHDIIARYGGEEFIIMSAEPDEAGLMSFGARLCKAVENEIIRYDGAEISVTVSLGAVIIMPAQTYEDAISAVDRALYAAKAAGRNRVMLGKIDT